LIVIGSGSEKEKLEKKSNENIDFKGFVRDKDLKDYILSAKALVFPGEEDFGMIPLEVMALGLPVIAFKRGGALETVIEDRENIHESSGLFFENQTVKSLQSTINLFLKEEQNFNPKWIRNHALNFEEKFFLARFQDIIEKFNKK
jgi:glycosyltransferase involved in cell wall biosynthesis